MLNMNTTKEEYTTIAEIAKRAVGMANTMDIQYDRMTAFMDINACHCNGNPLKLDELNKADDMNFAHDVFGIRSNINRHTGKLENCFSPRYSK